MLVVIREKERVNDREDGAHLMLVAEDEPSVASKMEFGDQRRAQ